MGLRETIATFREDMWYMNDSKLEKIKEAIKEFEGDFWRKMNAELTNAEENYQETYDVVRRVALEKVFRKFWESAVRHEGYAAILKDPSSYDAVLKKVRLEIQNMPEEVKKYFAQMDARSEQLAIIEVCS